MPRYDLTEEEAKVLFARQLEALAARGAAPDCAEQIGEILDENEAECLRLEQESAAIEAEDRERSSAVGG